MPCSSTALSTANAAGSYPPSTRTAPAGFTGIRQMVDGEGNIYNTCIGTGTQDTLEDYYRRATPINDSHGVGPVLLAACAAHSAA